MWLQSGSRKPTTTSTSKTATTIGDEPNTAAQAADRRHGTDPGPEKVYSHQQQDQ